MVKPMGIVAMLILLASGPAMASERIFTKQVSLWGVTESGYLYLQTKRGDKYMAPIEHCPVVKTDNTDQFSPVQFVKDADRVQLHMNGKFVYQDKTITLYAKESRLKTDKARCKIGPVQRVG